MTDKTINPASVPFKKLPSEVVIPAVGLGTFGSDNYDNETIAQLWKRLWHGFTDILLRFQSME